MTQGDDPNYQGREQALIKHTLLRRYLTQWSYKTGTAWDDLVFIDAFAGPWKVKDPAYRDSSFGVAIQALRESQDGMRAKGNVAARPHSLIVGKTERQYRFLEKFATENRKPGFQIEPFRGQFVDQIPAMETYLRKFRKAPFRFVFLDPKGWKDIPIEPIIPFVNHRACEVLINLMTSKMPRFWEIENRESSYRRLFGRDGVLEKLRNYSGEEGQEQAVREYCVSLKELCGFKYVSSAVILEPSFDAIRYFLIYATNHIEGISVFKNSETKAAELQEQVRTKKMRAPDDGNMVLALDLSDLRTNYFYKLRDKYRARAKQKILQELKADAGEGIEFDTLYSEAMAFPLVTPKDLKDWLRDFKPSVEVQLSDPCRKEPSPRNEDRVLVRDRRFLERL